MTDSGWLGAGAYVLAWVWVCSCKFRLFILPGHYPWWPGPWWTWPWAEYR